MAGATRSLAQLRPFGIPELLRFLVSDAAVVKGLPCSFVLRSGTRLVGTLLAYGGEDADLLIRSAERGVESLVCVRSRELAAIEIGSVSSWLESLPAEWLRPRPPTGGLAWRRFLAALPAHWEAAFGRPVSFDTVALEASPPLDGEALLGAWREAVEGIAAEPFGRSHVGERVALVKLLPGANLLVRFEEAALIVEVAEGATAVEIRRALDTVF